MTKPILFNTEMVRAILDGRKTVTRRVIKPRYRDDEGGFQVITTMSGEFVRVEKVDENECGTFPDGSERCVNSPYAIGDVLYVRETWSTQYNGVDDDNGYGEYVYKADGRLLDNSRGSCSRWYSSIHMPKVAARIFLKVTDVRVERLHDMDEEQMCNEGVLVNPIPPLPKYVSLAYCSVVLNPLIQKEFVQMWNSTINKCDLHRYGWEANPWVWVIEFERCVNPEIQLSVTLGMVGK